MIKNLFEYGEFKEPRKKNENRSDIQLDHYRWGKWQCAIHFEVTYQIKKSEQKNGQMSVFFSSISGTTLNLKRFVFQWVESGNLPQFNIVCYRDRMGGGRIRIIAGIHTPWGVINWNIPCTMFNGSSYFSPLVQYWD